MLIVPSLKNTCQNTLQSKLYQKLSQSLFNVEAKNKTKPEMVKDQIWLSTKGWQKNVNETEGDTWVGLKRTINKTDSGSYNLLNAQVVTAHLMGCRRVAEHVAESHPFVWPANFSLLAKSLESARQKESIVAWWSKPSKTKKKPTHNVTQFKLPAVRGTLVWRRNPCRGSNEAHPEQERFTRAEQETCQICNSNWWRN